MNLDYAFHHCECVIRMLRGDENALGDMDISADGFWRSFTAIAFSLPAFLFYWVSFARDQIAGGVQSSMGAMIGAQALIDLFLWLLPLVVLAFVLPPLGLGRNYTGLVIARNWLGAIFMYVLAGLAAIDMFVPATGDDLVALLYLIVLIVTIWMVFRVTNMALDRRIGVTSALVAVEFVVTYALAAWLGTVLGLFAS
ncbi:MAG: hypothetical protein AAFR13_00945 [Pseudomonadota bacterium]